MADFPYYQFQKMAAYYYISICFMMDHDLLKMELNFPGLLSITEAEAYAYIHMSILGLMINICPNSPMWQTDMIACSTRKKTDNLAF